MSIQDLNLTIKYHAGKNNVNADTLSRNHSALGEKQEALCRKISIQDSNNASIDHLTDAMHEIAQQKLHEIKVQHQQDADPNEMMRSTTE